MANGIIGINPATGKATIEYNGVRFYTADKSVIKMAQKGNVEGAALRWAGKTSTARAIRQANKAAAKPIYKEPSKALFKKMFKQGKKERLGTSAKERLEFAKEYKKTSKDIQKYIDQAVLDNTPAGKYIDRLPGDLQDRINKIISREVEKAYAAKGEVDDSDLENIYDEVTIEMSDYIIETKSTFKDLDPEELEAAQKVISNIEIYAAEKYSGVSGLSEY